MADRRRNGVGAQDIYQRFRVFLGSVFDWITHGAILPVGLSDNGVSVSLTDTLNRNNSRKQHWNGETNNHASGLLSRITWNYIWQKRGISWDVPIHGDYFVSNSSSHNLRNESVLVSQSVSQHTSTKISCLREKVLINLGQQQYDQDISNINYPDVHLSVVENLPECRLEVIQKSYAEAYTPIKYNGDVVPPSNRTHISTSSSQTLSDVHDDTVFSIGSNSTPEQCSTNDPTSLTGVFIEGQLINNYNEEQGAHLGANGINHVVSTDVGINSSTNHTPASVCLNQTPVPILDYACIQPVFEPNTSTKIWCLREMVLINLGQQQYDQDITNINYPDVHLSVAENLPEYRLEVIQKSYAEAFTPRKYNGDVVPPSNRTHISTSSSQTLSDVHDDRVFSIGSNGTPEQCSTDDPTSLTGVFIEGQLINNYNETQGTHLGADGINHVVSTDVGISSSTNHTPASVCLNQTPVAILDYAFIQPVFEPNGSKVVLGKGCFGEVSLVRHISVTGVVEFAAMKLFETDAHLKIAEEALVMAHLSDIAYVPKVIGLVVVGQRLALIQEYITSSITLFELLQGSFSPMLPSSGWLELCYQLAKGLALIHNHNTIINDIKEDNILVDITDSAVPIVKYIDMGNATIGYPGNYTSGPEILSVYTHLAPEVIQTGMTSYRADIFSLGRMYHRIALASHLPEIYNLAVVCTSDDPRSRPDAFVIENALKAVIDAPGC